MDFPSSWVLYLDASEMWSLLSGEEVIRDVGSSPLSDYDHEAGQRHYVEKGDTLMVVARGLDNKEEGDQKVRARVIDVYHKTRGLGRRRAHRSYFVVLVRAGAGA